tara:strand:+ start:325 stop:612 length:288 start_codon:yes stop_codon:yes gene_type:complete
MPKKVFTNYHPVLIEAAEIQAAKSNDYGNVDYSRSVYFPFGHESYLTMLHIKIERLKALKDAETVNFEGAYDSVLDLINYASFYGAYLKDKPHEK